MMSFLQKFPLHHLLGQGMVIGVFFITTGGCGTVGPPIPPESVGIEAKIQEQKTRATALEKGSKEEDITPIEEDEVLLPPLRPVGTR